MTEQQAEKIISLLSSILAKLEDKIEVCGEVSTFEVSDYD